MHTLSLRTSPCTRCASSLEGVRLRVDGDQGLGIRLEPAGDNDTEIDKPVGQLDDARPLRSRPAARPRQLSRERRSAQAVQRAAENLDVSGSPDRRRTAARILGAGRRPVAGGQVLRRQQRLCGAVVPPAENLGCEAGAAQVIEDPVLVAQPARGLFGRRPFDKRATAIAERDNKPVRSRQPKLRRTPSRRSLAKQRSDRSNDYRHVGSCHALDIAAIFTSTDHS